MYAFLFPIAHPLQFQLLDKKPQIITRPSIPDQERRDSMLSHAQIPVQKSRDSKDPEFSTPGVPGKLGIVKFALISNTTLQPNQTKQTPPLIITPHRAGTTEACRFCAEQVVFFFLLIWGLFFFYFVDYLCGWRSVFFSCFTPPGEREKEVDCTRSYCCYRNFNRHKNKRCIRRGCFIRRKSSQFKKRVNLFQFLLPLTDSTTFCFCGAACAEIPLQGEGRCASQVTKPIIPASFQSI